MLRAWPPSQAFPAPPTVIHSVLVAALVACAAPGSAQGLVALNGERAVWHVVDLEFQHDTVLSEVGTPDPFLDLRLQVVFTHDATGTTYDVPGFFDADGDAAESGSTAGDRWRVRFVPDRAGTWSWVASFRSGAGVAVDLDPTAGSPASFDGASGSFLVRPADPDAPGLRSKGLLRYEGDRLLRFAWNREAFLKGGADSPENLLGYWEIDGTVDQGGVASGLVTGGHGDGLHHFDAHLGDYVDGATWHGGEGKALFGALSYLASVGVDSVYFLTYNVDGGDGQEVFPWTSPGAKLGYDVSKLDQWERVLDHMTDVGLVLHLVTQETENDQVLDGGSLGTERMLYYRELIARFGCELGLVWNLGEESSNTDAQRMAFASYIRAVDPWDHPIAVHTFPSQLQAVYTPLLGFPAVELCSLQTDESEVGDRTLEWQGASAAAGRPWVVTSDEQNPADDGVVPDSVDPDHFSIRRDVLWGNLLAGGGGVEYYFGYAWPDDDLDCEDWRSRQAMWDQTAVALDFLRDRVDYASMRAADELVLTGGDHALAEDGEAYVVYTPDGGAPSIDLGSETGPFTVRWLDPRSGGALRLGSVARVSGPGIVTLGAAPDLGLDWVALVRPAVNRPPALLSHAATVTQEDGLTTVLVELHAEDPDGRADVALAGLLLVDPAGQSLGTVPLTDAGGDLWAASFRDVPAVAPGTWTYAVGVLDAAGRLAWAPGSFVVP